ncbi:MAG: MBL fold metallo-hydrolase [Planctomycetota bacterium]
MGVAQDAGVPHIGCRCPHCERFRDEPLLPSCLGLVGNDATYLIDATPAIAEQVARLPSFPGPILLTHAHMGHIAGLLQLGKEAWNRRTTVYASPALCVFLESHSPWNQLPLDLVQSTGVMELEPRLTVEFIPVPHRDENADTHALLIAGPEKKLLYLPDIDAWEIDLHALLARVDLALLDGSFYSADELPRQTDVPHPPIRETRAMLSDEEVAKVRFTHFNHTNPVLDVNGPTVLVAVQGEDIAL